VKPFLRPLAAAWPTKATRLLPELRLRAFSDFAKITAFDEGDKFIPFGMRQSNHVRILADCD
jgi:hypothetical protein